MGLVNQSILNKGNGGSGNSLVPIGAIINGIGDSITGQQTYVPSGQNNAPAWAQSTAYTSGQYAYANGNLYRSGGGTSNSSGSGPTGTSPATDGTITWTYVSPTATMSASSFLKWAQTFSMGRLLFDMTQGYGGCNGGFVKGFVVAGGSAYANNDTVTLNGGGTATLQISNGVITGVTITNPGFPNGPWTATINTSTGSGGILSFQADPSGTFATTGNRTQDMVASLPDALASNVKIFTVHGGHNDLANNVSYNTIISNLAIIYQTLAQAGRGVIAIPVLPGTGFAAYQNGCKEKVNRWIRAFCNGEKWANPNGITGVVLADPTGYFTDGTSFVGNPVGGSGGAAGAMTQDGIHPNPRGAMYIGWTIWEAAQAFLNPAPLYSPRPYSVNDGYSPSYNNGGNMLEGIAWSASTAYVVGDKVSNDTSPVKTYYCVTAGTSAGSGGPTGTGSNITDGSAHWAYTGMPAGTSVFMGTAGTLTAATGITYQSGSVLASGWASTRIQGTGAGTINAYIESPWGNGQAGQRQVLEFSLGSGAANELWEIYQFGNGNNVLWGIQPSDLGVTAAYAEAEIELSNLANFCGVFIEVLDAGGIGSWQDGAVAGSAGNHQMQSQGEMIPYPNNGKMYLRTPNLVFPPNMSEPIIVIRFIWDCSGGAGSATGTFKINYAGWRRANIA